VTPASPNGNRSTSSDAPALLSASGVGFAYGERQVLDSISLDLVRGELCALVGPNGSGKTTLVRALLGLSRPTTGMVSKPSGLISIGYVPQRVRFDNDVPATIGEIVASGLLNSPHRSRGDRKEGVLSALRDVGMEDRVGSKLARLSGGQQQRVLIARALVRDPALLVLDEPVAGVDAESQKAFHDILARQLAKGTSVLLVSHELSAVAGLVNRVVVLRNRGIEFDGPPEELETRGVSLGIHAHDLPVWLERA
jgi:zinc transport system ATP-binding protein